MPVKGECVYSARLDLIPPTTNNLYITTKNGRRFPNPKFKDVKDRMIEGLPKLVLEPAWYKLKITIFLPIYTKTGKNPGRVRKIDSSNRIKLLEDQLSKAIDLDDTFFKEVSISKINALEESTEVRIYYLSSLPEDWTKCDGEDTILKEL